MTRFYAILSILGWSWFVITMTFLWVRLRRNGGAAPPADPRGSAS